MKIAVLSDIHGNNYALKEVLKSAKKEKVSRLLILGDFVGYYYQPDEVFKMLGDWDYIFIKGNHENILEQLVLGNINENELRQKYGSGHKIASEKLAMANMDKLFKAPVSLTEKIDGVKLSLYHGAPWDTNQYIYPDAERSVLENCDEPDSDFVLLGHTHYSFIFHNRNSTLINPGSVGQSKNMGGLADWVVINTGNGVVEFKSTPYDTHPLEKEIDLLDPDLSFLKTVLKRNRN